MKKKSLLLWWISWTLKPKSKPSSLSNDKKVVRAKRHGGNLFSGPHHKTKRSCRIIPAQTSLRRPVLALFHIHVLAFHVLVFHLSFSGGVAFASSRPWRLLGLCAGSCMFIRCISSVDVSWKEEKLQHCWFPWKAQEEKSEENSNACRRPMRWTMVEARLCSRSFARPLEQGYGKGFQHDPEMLRLAHLPQDRQVLPKSRQEGPCVGHEICAEEKWVSGPCIYIVVFGSFWDAHASPMGFFMGLVAICAITIGTQCAAIWLEKMESLRAQSTVCFAMCFFQHRLLISHVVGHYMFSLHFVFLKIFAPKVFDPPALTLPWFFKPLKFRRRQSNRSRRTILQRNLLHKTRCSSSGDCWPVGQFSGSSRNWPIYRTIQKLGFLKFFFFLPENMFPLQPIEKNQKRRKQFFEHRNRTGTNNTPIFGYIDWKHPIMRENSSGKNKHISWRTFFLVNDRRKIFDMKKWKTLENTENKYRKK